MEKLTYDNVKYQCALCGKDYDVVLDRISCDCDGVLDLVFDAPALPSSLADRGVGLSRYREALAIDLSSLDDASLGTQRTPLLEMDSSLYVKCDFISPSGSFKDRGAQVLAALALGLGATRVVVDSSGNAGAAMAAHCARVGISCVVVAPASAPAGKLHQSRAYGADVRTVEGARSAATTLALELVSEEGTFYASHVENPFFLEGTQTWAFELWEQLGDAPTEVVMSVGNGSLFLGAYRGFRYLHRHGMTSRIPRMVAVQAKGWSALTKDLSHGDSPPLADGIAITAPRRLAHILKTIEETGGEVRTVDDEEIRRSTNELARRGCWVEPTSGAAWAGARESRREAHETVVVSLGGAGFKASAN
jgi:threonine synthase